MNVVEWRTRIEGENQDLTDDCHDVTKNLDSDQRRLRVNKLYSNDVAFLSARYNRLHSTEKFLFTRRLARHSPIFFERSRWSRAPISAARTSIFLALCLVVELVLPGRCRSNQSQPPVTCRRRAQHRHGDWAARQCSPTLLVLPWTKAN
jgi:hypothetical protein